MVTSTPVVMMTQNVAVADTISSPTTAVPPNNEHLSVTGGPGGITTTNTGHHMAANSNSPCGSSSATVVFSPAKLREDEKRIQMVRSIVLLHKYIYFSQVVPKMTSSILKKIARLCTPHPNDDLNKYNEPAV